MRFPARLLPHLVPVRPYLGHNAYGQPLWGPEQIVRARVERERKMVRDAEGTEVVVEATVWTRPDVPVPLGSLLTLDGTERTVLAVSPHTGRAEVEIVSLDVA